MDREIYSLKVYSTRMEYDAFQLELGPEENEAENDYFGMYFTMTVNCRGEQCAKLWGKLFDENRVYRSGMDILNVADPVDRAEVRLAEVFNGCMELREREKKWETLQGFSGYLNGVFYGARNRLTQAGTQWEDPLLPDELFCRLQSSYADLDQKIHSFS